MCTFVMAGHIGSRCNTAVDMYRLMLVIHAVTIWFLTVCLFALARHRTKLWIWHFLLLFLICCSIFGHCVPCCWDCSFCNICFLCVKVASNRSYVELPVYSKYLVIAAYIASYNPAKSDKRFFSKVEQSSDIYRVDQKNKPFSKVIIKSY